MGRRMGLLLVIVILVWTAACGDKSDPHTQAEPAPPEESAAEEPSDKPKDEPQEEPIAQTAPDMKMSDVKTYTVYYGPGKVEEMSKFDLAILETRSQNKQNIEALKQAGTMTVGYISVGELDPGIWYESQVDPAWQLGENVNWNSQFIDVRNVGWHDLLIDSVIPHILDYGVDGLFLDTVDTVDVDTGMKSAMAKLIQGIREAFPDIVIVMNRGFTVMDEVIPSIDAIMFESFSTNVDWDTVDWSTNPPKAVYPKWTGGSLKWTEQIAERLGKWQQSHGLTVLALDYANQDDEELIRFCYANAKREGKWDFIPYVSTLDLAHVYNHDNIKP